MQRVAVLERARERGEGSCCTQSKGASSYQRSEFRSGLFLIEMRENAAMEILVILLSLPGFSSCVVYKSVWTGVQGVYVLLPRCWIRTKEKERGKEGRGIWNVKRRGESYLKQVGEDRFFRI